MQATVPYKVLIDEVMAGVRVPTQANRLVLDIVLVIGFALFVAVCAQIAVRIPTTTVPITGQTFGVLLTGGVLGSKRGGLSMIVYALLGMAAAPVFAPNSALLVGKTVHFILPWSGTSGFIWDMSSGGYIVGFILGAYLVGVLSERGWDRRSKVPLEMLVGNIGIYALGLPWLAIFIASGAVISGTDLTYYNAIVGGDVLDKTLKGGLYPFIGGDALKLLLAALTLPGSWAVMNWLRGNRSQHR